MGRIQNKSQKLLYNLVYITLVFILVYQFGLGINLDLNFSLQLIGVLIGSSLVKFFLFNPLILYLLIAISILLGLLVNHYITPFIMPLFRIIYSLMQNIVYNLMGQENIAEENLLLYWGILIVLVSLVNAIILFRNKNIYLFLPLYIGVFLYYWYNFYDASYWLIAIFLLAFIILMGSDRFSREIKKLNKSTPINEEKLYSSWIQVVIKYSLLIVIIGLLLPKNYNYIRWPWLQGRVYSVFPFVEDLRSYDAATRGGGEAGLFNFSMTGAENGASRLGGPAYLSNRKIMTVYANQGHYLRGNVQQIYTGSSWESIPNPSSYHSIGENFSDWSTQDMRPFYNYVSLTIQNNDFASLTLFSPYKAARINIDAPSDIVLNRDDTLVFPDGVYDGESYRIWAQKPLPYGVLLANGIDFSKDDIDDIDIYLQIPEDAITDRTRDLVAEITGDLHDDYSKSITIEEYLRSNFEYNLSPDDIPFGHEFIDYFLFEGQEGYCTYYASAMAIMLRLEGIPTRYVEGYIALEETANGVYEVRHNNAHAWVEAFIEPVGWMQFEATPAYPVESRMENYQAEEVEEGPDTGPIPEDSSELDDYFERPEVTDDSEYGFNGGIIDREDSSDTESNPAITIIMLVLAMIMPLRLLLGLYRYKAKESQANKLPSKQRIIYLYNEVTKLISQLGYPQEIGETHYEYAQRVGYKFYDPVGDDIKGFKDITDIFVRSKYGDISTEEDIFILEEFRRILEIRLKNKLGTIKYFYDKYI